jgi:hypothetical protein
MSSTRKGHAQRKRVGIMLGVAMLVEAVGLWLRTGRVGGNVIVRCRSGHLFTTLWIPAVSVKALRLGWWRVQRCPVGHHFSLVTPVNAAELTEEDRARAMERHDIRLP